ncbi:MAG: hypothetical protein M1815_005164 [Lichina confinis]|nr:MAG: hypothetical protein M1815_005164 [Lichina confinis]
MRKLSGEEHQIGDVLAWARTVKASEGIQWLDLSSRMGQGEEADGRACSKVMLKWKPLPPMIICGWGATAPGLTTGSASSRKTGLRQGNFQEAAAGSAKVAIAPHQSVTVRSMRIVTGNSIVESIDGWRPETKKERQQPRPAGI